MSCDHNGWCWRSLQSWQLQPALVALGGGGVRHPGGGCRFHCGVGIREGCSSHLHCLVSVSEGCRRSRQCSGGIPEGFVIADHRGAARAGADNSGPARPPPQWCPSGSLHRRRNRKALGPNNPPGPAALMPARTKIRPMSCNRVLAIACSF